MLPDEGMSCASSVKDRMPADEGVDGRVRVWTANEGSVAGSLSTSVLRALIQASHGRLRLVGTSVGSWEGFCSLLFAYLFWFVLVGLAATACRSVEAA